jgi:hypothetical protein
MGACLGQNPNADRAYFGSPLANLFWRWLHCLTRLHRPVTGYDHTGRTVMVACDCGRVFSAPSGD